MDIDGAPPPAGPAEPMPQAAPVQARAPGAAPLAEDGAVEGVDPCKWGQIAEAAAATRRGQQRRSGGGEGAMLFVEGCLRHPSRSPPKKVPRWRGRSAGAGGCAPPRAGVAARVQHDADMLSPGACQEEGAAHVEREQALGVGGQEGVGAGSDHSADGGACGAPVEALAVAAGASGRAHVVVALLRSQVEQGCIEEVWP